MFNIKKELEENYALFEGIGKIYDEDVYQHVKRHSRLIDRINPRKMVLMTFYSFDFLNHSLDEPKNKNFKYFSGKDRFWG